MRRSDIRLKERHHGEIPGDAEAGAVPTGPAAGAVRAAAASPEPDAGDEETQEEIPFIEVGPHKSMEASASVLAAGPAPTPVAAAVPPSIRFRPSPAETLPRRPHFAPEVIAHHQPDHPVSGQYRELLAAVTPPAAGEAAPVLLLTPALPGADAVPVLLNLAVTAARKGGRRVIVMDADLQRPTLADRLGLAARPGLADVLAGAGDAGTGAAARRRRPTWPSSRPAGRRRRGRGWSWRRPPRCCGTSGSAAAWRWSWVQHWPDAAALAAACDVVYLVLPEQEVAAAKVDELLQTIPRQGARLGGCILAAG